MSRKRVAIYGAGYLGQQIHHHVVHHCAHEAEVVGFVDDTKPPGEVVVGGSCTLGSLAEAARTEHLKPGALQLVFAIGYSDMRLRRLALERALAAGYGLFTVVHPRAQVEPGAVLGQGCVVLAGAVVDQQVRVGAACFIDIGVRLTAGTWVGCNNYFSSGTSMGSRVRVGDDCFFGMDCTVTTDVQMGSNLFVNAKTLVPRNVGSHLKLVEVHKGREVPMPPQ